MERLLQPDLGLMVWTVVTFLVLVFVLKATAWKPLLKALDDREAAIKRAIEDAQAAKASAEQMKAQFERELAQGQQKAAQMMAQANADAQKVREKILKETEEESLRLRQTTSRQIDEEKNQALREIRNEVASLAIKAAEKVVRHEVNAKNQEELLRSFFEDLDKQKTKEQLH